MILHFWSPIFEIPEFNTRYEFNALKFLSFSFSKSAPKISKYSIGFFSRVKNGIKYFSTEISFPPKENDLNVEGISVTHCWYEFHESLPISIPIIFNSIKVWKAGLSTKTRNNAFAFDEEIPQFSSFNTETFWVEIFKISIKGEKSSKTLFDKSQ